MNQWPPLAANIVASTEYFNVILAANIVASTEYFKVVLCDDWFQISHELWRKMRKLIKLYIVPSNELLSAVYDNFTAKLNQ